MQPTYFHWCALLGFWRHCVRHHLRRIARPGLVRRTIVRVLVPTDNPAEGGAQWRAQASATACFTSAAIFASSVAVTSVSA
jgi:hypothetical protein